MGTIPVIIPAYEPDDKLIGIVERLKKENLGPIVVVNDGSDLSIYGHLFDKAKELGCIVLFHAVNMGKGRALKTAFNFCLNEYPDLIGVVTADSDGQHRVEDIRKCMDALIQNQEGALILGCRNFNQENVPVKSSFGNKTTSRVMKVLVGLSISDTQTGLRGITRDFMKYLLTEKGERFEFETNMLLATKELGINIVEVPIETIYLEENKGTHFNPIRDSVMIYAVFLKFIFSSLSSAVVDAVMFMIACACTRDLKLAISYTMLSTIVARLISSTYNFMINYKVVFKGKGKKTIAAVRYIILALVIMLLSGSFVTLGHNIFPNLLEIWIKIPVDTVLFFLSFFVQRELVYKD